MPPDLPTLLQDLAASEIPCVLECNRSGFAVRIGEGHKERKKAFDSAHFPQISAWLHEQALKLYPNSIYTRWTHEIREMNKGGKSVAV